jgi:long-subunit fatty acid transport protein
MLRGPGVGGAALAFVLTASGTAQAQLGTSLNRAGSGARAAGMANAFVAVSDDGTAASWNPAGLAQLRKPEFSLVYEVNHNGLQVSGIRSPDDRLAFSNYGSDYTRASLDFASATVPFAIAGKPVTAQVGWQRLYQLSGSVTADVSRYPLMEPGPPPGSILVDSWSRGDIDLFSLSSAVKLTKNTSLGASFNVWRGQWTERVSLTERGGAPASDFYVLSDHNRVRGHNVTAGLLMTYPSWNLGLVYHSPFWSSYRLGSEVLSNRTPPLTQDGGDAARFRFPRSLAAGLAWRPGARWTVAFDLTHDQWTDALVDRIAGLPGPLNFLDGAPPAISTTRDTVSLNLGAEHLFLREGSVVPLRLGLAWEPQGAMDPVTRDPVDFLMLAAGAGYNTNRFKLDAAVQYRWGGFRGSQVLSVASGIAGGLARDALGQVGTQEWRIKVSVIYRIQDTDKLRDLLRKVF